MEVCGWILGKRALTLYLRSVCYGLKGRKLQINHNERLFFNHYHRELNTFAATETVNAAGQGNPKKTGVKGRCGMIIVTNNGILEAPVGSCLGSHKIGKTVADFMGEMTKACKLQLRVQQP